MRILPENQHHDFPALPMRVNALLLPGFAQTKCAAQTTNTLLHMHRALCCTTEYCVIWLKAQQLSFPVLEPRQVAKCHKCGEARKLTSTIFLSFTPDLRFLVRILLSLAMVTCPVNSLLSQLSTPAGLRHAKLALDLVRLKEVLESLPRKSVLAKAYKSCVQPCPVARVRNTHPISPIYSLPNNISHVHYQTGIPVHMLQLYTLLHIRVTLLQQDNHACKFQDKTWLAICI